MVKAWFICVSTDFFSKTTFWKNSFRNTLWGSNSLDPDQARYFVWPDLGPTCLQKLSADDTRVYRVKLILFLKEATPVENVICLYIFVAFYLFEFTCWAIFHALFVVCWHFSKLTFKKILLRMLSKCQTVWIQIKTNILLILIWVQTVCKAYQQRTKVTASKDRVNDKICRKCKFKWDYKWATTWDF